jgi:hypothetical protein
MFKRLAKFRILEPRRVAPGLRKTMPANDNLPGFRRAGRPRRIRSRVLVCRWFLADGGTRLGCRWQPEALAPTAHEDSDSDEAHKRTFQSLAMILQGPRRISHRRLRTVLSGTRRLERPGALLALGQRRKSQ